MHIWLIIHSQPISSSYPQTNSKFWLFSDFVPFFSIFFSLSPSLYHSCSSLSTFHLIILHPSFFSLFFRSSFLLHLHSVSKQTWTSWHVLAIISVYKINNNKLSQRDDILNQLKPRWTIISHFVINHSIFVPWLLRFSLVVVFLFIFRSVVSFVLTRNSFDWSSRIEHSSKSNTVIVRL